MRWLQERGTKRVGLHGSSYGAGAALLAAAKVEDVVAVVADSAFADMRDLMDAELRRKVGGAGVLGPGIVVVGKLLHGLDLAEIAPVRAVPAIAPRPISFLHGAQDDRIPVSHARRLKDAAQGAKDALWILENGGHSVAHEIARDEYFRRTVDFLAAHL